MKNEKLNIILPEKKGIQVGDILKNPDGELYEITSLNGAEGELRDLRTGNKFSGFPVSDMKEYFKKLNRHAILKPSRGKKKGFYFNLVGDNFEIVGTSEVYTTKAMARKTLKKYFPSFKIEQ